MVITSDSQSSCTCRVLDSYYFQFLQTVALFFVLFVPDIMAIYSVPDSADPIIDAFLLATMVIFGADLFLSFTCRPKMSWLEVMSSILSLFLAKQLSTLIRARTCISRASWWSSQACMHACMYQRVMRAQMFMNLATTALIVLDLSWVQDAVIETESTGYLSLTRALVLASQAGAHDPPAAHHAARAAG